MASLVADKRVLVADLHGDRIRAASRVHGRVQGNVEFKNAGMGGGGGIRAALKRAAAGESISLMDCTGQGRVYLAKDAMDVLVVDLAGDTLNVESRAHPRRHRQPAPDVQFSGLRGTTAARAGDHDGDRPRPGRARLRTAR